MLIFIEPGMKNLKKLIFIAHTQTHTHTLINTVIPCINMFVYISTCTSAVNWKIVCW